MYNPFIVPVSDYTKIGSYVLLWDGFDNDEIYDSSRFNNKTLIAKIIGKKGDKEKSKEVRFHSSYKEVEWVDVKIDKKAKKIDTTLRVDLQDGGNEGLNNGHKVSAEAVSFYNLPPLTTQVKVYTDLEKFTLNGISQFWSRNLNNIGRGVNINNELFEVFVIANSNNKGLAAPKIVYQTNTEEGRSRNWELSRILYFYEGYTYRSNWKDYPSTHIRYRNKGWIYTIADLDDFKMVSAHEIGHEILLTYGGQKYSKSHKESTTILTQETLPTSPSIPLAGEIDLMKYYQNYYDIPRTIISEFDLLKLLWLTKLKIK